MFWRKKKTTEYVPPEPGESKWTTERYPNVIKKPRAVIVTIDELHGDVFTREDFQLDAKPLKKKVTLAYVGFYKNQHDENAFKTDIWLEVDDDRNT